MRENFRRFKNASWGIGEEVLERGDGPVDHGASDESRGGGPEIQHLLSPQRQTQRQESSRKRLLLTSLFFLIAFPESFS